MYLLAGIFSTWFLWAFAAVLQNHVRNVHQPLPDGQRRGTSIVPVIPLFPLVSWGIAKTIDAGFAPWGTIAIGSMHGAFALVLVGSVCRDALRLRKEPPLRT